MCVTGNGATFALTQISGGAEPPNSGAIGTIVNIAERGDSLPVIDNDDIASTGPMKKCFGDTSENPVLTLTVVLSPSLHVHTLQGVKGVLYTGTLTYPIETAGNTTPATESGSGAIVDVRRGQMTNNERVTAEIDWQFDNDSDAYATTDEAA